MFRDGDGYRRIVTHFLTSGNRVNAYDIERVEPSRYAIPLRLLSQIHGETIMSWTAFVLEMRDGAKLAFGTSFLFDFFNLPQPYTYDDVVAVYNHACVSKTGELIHLREGRTDTPPDYGRAAAHREMPYFVCYADTVPRDG